MASIPVTSILEGIAAAGKAYSQADPGARENLVELSHTLIAALEIPSEFVQRSFWAEVSLPSTKHMPLSYLTNAGLYGSPRNQHIADSPLT